MDLKKKYENTKKKIKENPYLPLAVASLAVGYYAVSVAIHNKNLLDAERANHARCHSTAKWLYRVTKEGAETTIGVKDNMYYVKKDDPTED